MFRSFDYILLIIFLPLVRLNQPNPDEDPPKQITEAAANGNTLAIQRLKQLRLRPRRFEAAKT